MAEHNQHDINIDQSGLKAGERIDLIKDKRGNVTGIKKSKSCFPSGTLITTPNGKKDISVLRKGDLVTSLNPKNQETAEKAVLKVIHHKKNRYDIYKIYLANGSVVKTTGIHSFLVENQWTKAKDLQTGSYLQITDCNGKVIKEKIKLISVKEECLAVYNLIVEDDFTFIANDCVVHSFTYLRFLRSVAWSFYSGLLSIADTSVSELKSIR